MTLLTNHLTTNHEPPLSTFLACATISFTSPKERRAVIGNAILDRPLDAAGAHRLAVTDRLGARRIQHLEVLERVPVHHDQVGQVPRADPADPVLHAEDARVVLRRAAAP